MITTIFFDFDGVVIDSEPVHTETKAMVLDAYGISYPDDVFDNFKGVPEDKFFMYASEHLDSQHRPYELFIKKRREYLAEFLPKMPMITGFLDFMEHVKLKGLRTALVTSSTQQELQNLDKYLNIMGLFDQVISADATLRHKPFPDPYFKALDLMEVDQDNAMVIEDSFNGILSGKKAGCKVYALTSTFSRQELINAGADCVFDSYEELRLLLDKEV
ncbi:HAD family phosphatase [Limibacter armeniacum]|uniref:HAD family hydrolase n=1 Tax=Limibacter armeniacum TaxID=466084 RepID=UPI002FE5CFAA